LQVETNKRTATSTATTTTATATTATSATATTTTTTTTTTTATTTAATSTLLCYHCHHYGRITVADASGTAQLFFPCTPGAWSPTCPWMFLGCANLQSLHLPSLCITMVYTAFSVLLWELRVFVAWSASAARAVTSRLLSQILMIWAPPAILMPYELLAL
jgi:hypothetical protein